MLFINIELVASSILYQQLLIVVGFRIYKLTLDQFAEIAYPFRLSPISLQYLY